jgi:hypothetical protein
MNDTTAAVPMPAGYPIEYDVEPQLRERNRLTVGFRIILAIPHAILVGGPGFAFGGGFQLVWWDDGGDWGTRFSGLGGNGLLGIAAAFAAIIAWFAILFTRSHPRGIWDFTHYFMRWRSRAMAYMALLRDEYPPFGDGEYAVTYRVEYPTEGRDLWAVGLRIIYVIPHLIVLFFLSIAWIITAVIAWFAILFTGEYPEGLYKFAVGYLRWTVRVETYLYLMRDEYPPFPLEP